MSNIAYIQGTGSPEDVHPDNIGKSHTKQPNFGQRIPYFSEVWKKDPQMAAALDDAIADICEYVHTLVATHLPQEYVEIKAFVDVLPLNHSCTTYPFASFVINIQAVTKAHLDAEDKVLCVVIPFGSWEGGQLVLHEAGVVLDLVMGDVVIFLSGRLTHFNLDFKGRRCSLVMFTDRHGDEWVKNRNGWAHHIATGDEEMSDLTSEDET
jgi:hypothetical protein